MFSKIFINYFEAMNQLQLDLFACYIQKDYVLRKDFYEKRINKARITLLRSMKKIRMKYIAHDEANIKRLTKFESLYEMIFSLNILKLRITDYATFEICEAEFRKISNKLSDVLKHIIVLLGNRSDRKSNQLIESTAKIMGKLSHQIDSLAELYRTTLQVVSPDPIFFLFFVEDLIALRDELESFILGLIND